MDQADYVRETMRPLLPVETGWAPKLPKMEGIEAVVFDLYGTLIVSTAGTFDPGSEQKLPGDFTSAFPRIFRSAVERHQAKARARGIAYPEVEIREVWEELVEAEGLQLPEDGNLESLALRYECAVNPVWMMPHAGEIIESLRRSGMTLGILSNAQFYTLAVMEGLFGSPLPGLGFEPSLCVFSFEERVAKPSTRFFEILSEKAKHLGIESGKIFYLGNDMIKDILPAREAGFRTGLFAGDARSLRPGQFKAEEAAEIADAVITDLAQLPEILNK